MIDAGMVLRMVRSGQVPPQWQVVRAKRGFFLMQSFLGVLLVILGVGGAVALLASGTVIGYGLSDTSPDGVVTFWFVVDMLVLAACVIGGIVLAIQQLLRLGTVDEQVLVLMPDGFVMRRGSAPKDTLAYSYDSIRAVDRVVRNGTNYLVMQPVQGRAVRLTLDGRFGPPKRIAQQIQAMAVDYRAARARAGNYPR